MLLQTDYHEHLHESPFHKLAVKIKHHHDKHLKHQQGAAHLRKKPLVSYVSTENFYGSVDVTKQPPSIANGAYDNASKLANTPEMSPYQAIADQDNNSSKEGSYAGAYDNANPSTVRNGVSPGAMPSPKYDLVAHEMSVSHESERIYAEVTEEMMTPNING